MTLGFECAVVLMYAQIRWRLSRWQTTQYRYVNGTPMIAYILILLQYVTNQATRIVVKAAGELSVDAAMVMEEDLLNEEADTRDGQSVHEAIKAVLKDATIKSSSAIDIEQYIPSIGSDRRWLLSELDLGFLLCLLL